MPKPFENCVKMGGKVRTVSGPNKRFGLKAGQYVKVCFMNGEMHRGYVEEKDMHDTEMEKGREKEKYHAKT